MAFQVKHSLFFLGDENDFCFYYGHRIIFMSGLVIIEFITSFPKPMLTHTMPHGACSFPMLVGSCVANILRWSEKVEWLEWMICYKIQLFVSRKSKLANPFEELFCDFFYIGMQPATWHALEFSYTQMKSYALVKSFSWSHMSTKSMPAKETLRKWNSHVMIAYTLTVIDR